ncbi:MAG: HAD family phosphatase [Candidatus Saccharimonadales bacterium]
MMRKQKFAAFDIDGTLFRSGLYREVSYELTKMGKIPEEIANELTTKHREWRDRIHGNAFEEFDQLLVVLFDGIATQIRVDDYDEAVRRVIQKKAENVYVYTRDLIKQCKNEGYFVIAISGSQVDLVEPFAMKYGFDTWVGSEWERGGEFFTGRMKKSHTGKDVIIKRLIDEHDLTLAGSIAVGDSNGDVGMLGMVDRPIAFNPTAELYEKAARYGWTIVVERKNMMYELAPNDQNVFELREARIF